MSDVHYPDIDILFFIVLHDVTEGISSIRNCSTLVELSTWFFIDLIDFNISLVYFEFMDRVEFT
jgi:hypothetical protein